MPFLEGFLWGLGFIIFIGPVFFTLLQAALKYGAKAGVAVALGIVSSDAAAILLCLAGLGAFFENESNQFWLALIGGFILIGLGLKFLLKPNVDTSADLSMRNTQYVGYFMKGFAVNFINPFVFIVWISIIGMAHGKYDEDADLYLFLGAVLIGIISTDLTKVFFAHRLRKLINPKFLRRIFRVIGVLLLLFAVRLLWYSLEIIHLVSSPAFWAE